MQVAADAPGFAAQLNEAEPELSSRARALTKVIEIGDKVYRSISSDDLEASLEGYFLLQEPLSYTSARCKLRFKPSEDFLNRNPKFKDLIDLSNMNKAKGQDGFYGYSFYGRLANPQIKPRL